ncbi:Pkinase-domain-containing protein [Hesseltinella vesiculosa]|uniref:Pkinase-domain-containing protein n=1 Tax=Hesseltinella vesiculosa TaxID=101127 RepID=A0A1X2GU85_9FUNG|nr:Pkinase-domain-containing protein [Hesseltinella vesiculosa]
MESTISAVHAKGQVTVTRHRSVNDLLHAMTDLAVPSSQGQMGHTGIVRRRTVSGPSLSPSSSWHQWLPKFMSFSHHPRPKKRTHHTSYSTRLGDYRLLKLIGASAKVYSAQHLPNETSVAMKKIELETMAMSCAQFEALYHEVQIMSLSRHPHLLPILSSFVSGSNLYIITPNMSAGSCLDLLQQRSTGLPESVVACIVKQVLLGLVYLHENGLIHRDVKAANLLVEADTGVIKLADFGVSGQLIQGMSQRHSFVGSPCWLAPEVLWQRGYDAKVDLWSLGITCIELLRGRPPFHDAKDAFSVFDHILHDPPPFTTMPPVSSLCRDFIHRGLQKKPRQRWSADDAHQHPWFQTACLPERFATLLATDFGRYPLFFRQ